ncbi:MAG: sn-glycerol-3-phosphate ABC transporter ATP-binding protein UgpC [Acidimicrobiales bacterium]
MASISIEKVSKVYPNGFQAVDELDIRVAEGEFMVMVGPSGCGKTTALRMVAGLEEISSGTLRIGDRVANNLTSKERDVAMVFQNYALYPHMSVAQNIAFGLSLRKTPKNEIAKKVADAAAILGLSDLLDRKPGLLSGGQRQRVAMGRAIVRDPKIFLMDEPLSNLDAKLRVQMRTEVRRIQRRIGVATLYVTHDQTEAMTMGDRVAVMRLGVLQQCDHPQVLYNSPANLFVAAFIGSPSMNLFEAALSEDGTALRLGSQTIAIEAAIYERHPGLAAFRGRALVVGFRAEDLPVASGETAPGPTMKARVEEVEALGSELLVHFSIDATRVGVDAQAQSTGEDLDLAAIDIVGEGVARVEPRASLNVGGDVLFRVFPERMHFFDPESQNAIS